MSEMLQNNIIEPSASPWASNVVLVRKAKRQMRFCVDYRQFNLQTYKDSYPHGPSRPFKEWFHLSTEGSGLFHQIPDLRPNPR